MNRFFLFLLCLLMPSVALSESQLRLTVGESKVLGVESTRKVAVGNPAIADVTAVSDTEILVTGRSPGNTNLLFVSPSGRRQTSTVTVTAYQLKKAMVELGVEIMEIETNSSLKAGLNWGSLTDSTYTSNSFSVKESQAPTDLTIGSFRRETLSANLQLLMDRGKAKLLAKPKLLTVSGEEASFLAGGEIPYVLENSLGNAKVEWKPYGVKLKVRPSVDSDGNILASLKAEVSGLDLQNGTSTSNGSVVVPALKTRWAETTVYMKGGSTLVIAGLIQEENQKITSGLPLLGDIPVLGELFRSTRLDKRQTELVVFVTPSVVGQNPAGL